MVRTRSTKGCWTCKLRKKKCDEVQPNCDRCTKSGIECLGYGEKPSWIVRSSNPKGKRGSISAPGVAIKKAGSGSETWSKDKDAELLLYYLEKVFPLQWQYYKGSNYWILPLLSRSKAMFHAVLSIAAVHMASAKTGIDEYLQMHHELTLKELRNTISIEKDPETNVKSLAAVVMLVSYELFRGGYENWEVHLNAGVALMSLITDEGRECGPLYNAEIARIPENQTRLFLTACIIWMDVSSCGIMGKACGMDSYLHRIVRSKSFVPMEELMGCKTEVFIQLNEVAKLHDWKRRLQAKNSLSVTQLIERGSHIQKTLGLALRETAPNDPLIDSTTKLFALAILVYLSGVISGFSPANPDIMEAVDEAISLMRRIPQNYYRGNVFPICVFGSMCDRKYYGFFLDLFIGGAMDVSFGNTAVTLKIIQRTWELRDANSDKRLISWFDAVEDLQLYALLV
ncbi:unnamed protein product [Kuraishia capsulata CBS 1993]|uniref:Zn(2)-C6 fungal-type domain-containing protein n=1 Tax=Kuraishia capsulata CBS 1993 TaxID=1382522 RepID=W6MXP5_9ASCO|nr:uncharacterized protein KUCA_T00005238001 [Kuraishia capsulata CBS 1993]CDK29250.1 unnamed protein product [Kuraishia capsulata CBS 1993]